MHSAPALLLSTILAVPPFDPLARPAIEPLPGSASILDLAPCNAVWTDTRPGYANRLRTMLVRPPVRGWADYRTLASLLVVPSFETESLISLYLHEETFFLGLATPEQSIWYASHKPFDSKRSYSEAEVWNAPAPKIKVVTSVAAVDPSVAESIQRLWILALHETKYPSPNSRNGEDGVTYTFSAFNMGVGELCGRTWSPQPGLTSDLVAVGTLLRDYISASPPDRSAIALRITSQSAALTSALEKLAGRRPQPTQPSPPRP